MNMINKKTNESFLGDLFMSKFAVNDNIKNNNITIVRNIAYKRIKDMRKDIKEITPELSDHFLQKVDINMKVSVFISANASLYYPKYRERT